MAITKFILPVLAVAGAALAQSSTASSTSASSSSTATSCPTTSSGAFTITSQTDADELEDCSTFDGTVIIDSSVSGNLEINGVQQITGNLTCTNATGLTSLSTDQLNSIGGYFSLTELTVLSNLQMSSLTSVNIIDWEALPALQELNFDQGVQTASGVRVVNTQLSTLSGIELNAVGAFEITNNPYLLDFNVNNLQSISSYITVQANGEDLSIEFPNLLTAENMTLGNISSLSVPSLANVTGALGFYSNTFLNFSAANLTSVGNALVFDSNSVLNNISFPLLTTIGGGFQVANNSKLVSVEGFPLLKDIGGAVDLVGVFDNFSMPSLADVKGGFTMESTGDVSCSSFKSAKSSKVIKGTYTCSANEASTSSSSSSSSSSTSSGSSSSSSSTSNAGSVEISMAAVVLMGVVAGLFVI